YAPPTEGRSRRAVHPLRAMTVEEGGALARAANASSERVDVVKRARAVLAVRAGQSSPQAAREAGTKRGGDSVSQLVARCNQQGAAALHSAGGRGRNVQYPLAPRERSRAALQRGPERAREGTATWSLKPRERARRQQAALPPRSAAPLRTVLPEAG
ncbi:MAG TPA: helix-turn-helix domain-containing protein, partial [Ktedonobacterales bacterium]|nr:helix-turn-helix domain-containing protein [Ktedonobacterales bacterium]